MMKAQYQQGFTLIEIAVVLVIIGLLLGGTLKGQQLIENARLKRIKSDYDQYSGAYYGYQDLFWALPGDDKKASTNLDSASGVLNGDGDGVVSGATESVQFWLHLRAANLIAGTGNSAPQHALGGSIALVNNGAGMEGPCLCFSAIKAGFAQQLDKQYDDGEGSSGLVRGRNAAGVAVDYQVGESESSYNKSLCFAFE